MQLIYADRTDAIAIIATSAGIAKIEKRPDSAILRIPLQIQEIFVAETVAEGFFVSEPKHRE